MKICHPTQHFNVVSHSAACFGSQEPSSGTPFYNTNQFGTSLLDKEIKKIDQKKTVVKERAPPLIKMSIFHGYWQQNEVNYSDFQKNLSKGSI